MAQNSKPAIERPMSVGDWENLVLREASNGRQRAAFTAIFSAVDGVNDADLAKVFQGTPHANTDLLRQLMAGWASTVASPGSFVAIRPGAKVAALALPWVTNVQVNAVAHVAERAITDILARHESTPISTSEAWSDLATVDKLMQRATWADDEAVQSAIGVYRRQVSREMLDMVSE